MVDNIFISVTRVCSTIAAFWALALAFLILYDITGRAFFNSPFDGTIEIVANSMVSILFLQMPYTIYRGAHLRTAVIYQNMGDYGQRAIDVVVAALGIWFFFSIALGAWEDMLIGWEVDEREGEGSIRVPIYPVRTLLVIFACISLIAYAILGWHSLFGTRPVSDDFEREGVEGSHVDQPL